MQVAAVCYRRRNSHAEFLLVNTNSGAKWTFPKGMPEADAGKIGLRLANPNDELLKKWDLADVKNGAVVTAVERNSLAAKAGIAPGDVITKVGSTDVKDAQSATEVLSKVDPKKGVRLYVTTKDPESGQVMSRFVFVRGE